MKKIFLVLCAFMTLSAAQANVMLNEHFDRTLGTLSASTWSGGKLPNDSNWHTYSPGTVQFQVVSEQLQKTDYCTASSGKAVQYSANHSRDYILFPQAFNGTAGNNVYMAFLMIVSELQTTSSSTSATNANNSIMSFAIDASNNALGSLNGRVLIQTVDESSYKLGVSRRGEMPQFAEQVLSKNSTYLIVAEYCFIAGEKNDIVNLYIDPTPSAQTLAVASVNPSTASADTETLVGIALCSNGNTPTNMLIDEIRVATSWNELWEDSSAPTPVISVAGSLAFGDVTKGEAAEKTLSVQGENLQGPISVLSDKAELVPAVSSISAADAAAGYTLSLSLTATQEGAGSANLTFSSPGASDQIVVVSWNAKKPVPPIGSELLLNGSFEEYSCNAVFGCSFTDWNFPLNTATANSTDKLDGDNSMCMNPTMNATLDQSVMLTDAEYAAGTLFELKIHYKVLEIPEGTSLDLDCYWEPSGGGDAEAMKQHEAAVLQRSIATEVSSEWEELVLTTSKPAGSTYFRVRMTTPKNAKVLFDNFSLVRTESAEPFILVTPNKLSPVETTIGNSVIFPTLHIEQGNLTGPTTFELSYTNADQFSLSASSLAADKSSCDLVITYTPKAAGSHIAYLNIINESHPLLNRSIKIEGSCSDPSAQPSVTVTPVELVDFEVLVSQDQQKTFTVSSVNCIDHVYLSVSHETGAAFTIDETLLPKNSTRVVTVTFRPMEAGEYLSKVRIYSNSNEFEDIELTLRGIGKEATPETVDWKVDFQWDMSQPLAILDEHFDNAEHNKTLLVDGWQNVAKATARPWWGFDEARTAPARGEKKYAKATAYQYAKDSTDKWEMWLVTPALDYKNTPSQVFTFKVMGEYLPEEGNKALFEIYFIDASDPTKVFFQSFDGLSIPKTSDENNVWVPFQIHLENQANIPDAFFMAFRYASPNGADGVVTYYVDDVTWGIAPQGVENIPSSTISTQKMLRDGQIIILRGEKKYSIMGQEVR